LIIYSNLLSERNNSLNSGKMLGRVALRHISRTGLALRALRPLAVRNASAVAQHDDYGHHDHHDTGPPTTMEEMPVPFQSYQVVHGELQGKFNMMLFGSIGFLLASLVLAFATDSFDIEAWRPPKSYRERKVV